MPDTGLCGVGSEVALSRENLTLDAASTARHDRQRTMKRMISDRVLTRTIMRWDKVGYPGTACVVPKEFDGANCVDVVFASPNPKIILPEYFYHFINSGVGKAFPTYYVERGYGLSRSCPPSAAAAQAMKAPIIIDRKV